MSVCPACGAEPPPEFESCRAMFDSLHTRGIADGYTYTLHRLIVDAYALQHPDPFCLSARSLAAHLAGLCGGLEHNGAPSVNAAIQRWLSGPVQLQKPPLPAHRATMTLADVFAVADPVAFGVQAHRWAESVWDAWDELHGLAREWLGTAMSQGARPR